MRYFKVVTERETKGGHILYFNFVPEHMVYGIHTEVDSGEWQIGLKFPVFESESDARKGLYWEVCEPRFYENPFEDDFL